MLNFLVEESNQPYGVTQGVQVSFVFWMKPKGCISVHLPLLAKHSALNTDCFVFSLLKLGRVGAEKKQTLSPVSSC